MDDRSTLERAFSDFWAGRLLDPIETAPTAKTPQPLLRGITGTVVLGEFAFLAADRATPATPWTRWKSASCDLVNWWAARLMRRLYIRPFRICPQVVRIRSPHIETAPICLPDRSVANAALAMELRKLGVVAHLPHPGTPLGKGADERSAAARADLTARQDRRA